MSQPSSEPSTNDRGAERIRSTVAELRSVSDWLDRQRERVGSMAEPFLGSERDDVVTALHEAERQLSLANRAVERAIRTADQRGG